MCVVGVNAFGGNRDIFDDSFRVRGRRPLNGFICISAAISGPLARENGVVAATS